MSVAVNEWDRLADALEYPEGAPPPLQEEYVDAFDLNPACTLELGWHLFGDTPERGAFLSILREDLRRARIDERGNLPDYLPTVLRLIGRQDEPSASSLAAIIAPAVARIHEQLKERGSPFADALETVAHRLGAGYHCEAHP